MRSLVVFVAIVGLAAAQYEAGHVKILQDKRYQEGSNFGNFRDQEDGIKYQEETDSNNIRRGFWEYPDENGKILRVEFEAGAGIGFRITSSNYLASGLAGNTITAAPQQSAPLVPVPHQAPAPRQAPVHHQAPAPRRAPVPTQALHQAPLPVARAQVWQAPLTTTTPGPMNLFDYAANLDFSRHANGHSFKFTAT